ncbi:MAG: phage holin family protein [bacterium]|nr:phage holin family protein [bacterium]MDA1292556.1 phage holin family protein [bacterium]
MSSESSSHLPLKLTLKFVFNVIVVYVLTNYAGQYFGLDGGIPAYIIVGALMSLLNIFFRPILNIITLPLRFFATIIAIMIVNGAFVYVIQQFTLRMDPGIIALEIYGGPWGWIVISVCFGFANWLLKEMFK